MKAYQKQKHFPIIFGLLCLSNIASAVGPTDYTLDIGDGYFVFRASKLEVCITDDKNVIILHPKDYEDVGPVVGYDMRSDYILTKNAGRVPRNKFEGDSVENVDYDQEWYFLIPKATDKPLGPYLKEEFLELLRKKNLKEPGWSRPKNPDTWLPFLGGLFRFNGHPYTGLEVYLLQHTASSGGMPPIGLSKGMRHRLDGAAGIRKRSPRILTSTK